MKRASSILAILLLLGIVIFSTYKYLSALKEKNVVLGDLSRTEEELAILESEKEELMGVIGQEQRFKEQLTQHSTALNENLKIYQEQLTQLEAQLAQVEAGIAELSSRLPALRLKNASLRQEGSGIKSLIFLRQEENEGYRVRLNSLAGLQKSIKELQEKMSRVIKGAEKISPALDYGQGNRGFILLGGRSTYSTQAKIEVLPALPAD